MMSFRRVRETSKEAYQNIQPVLSRRQKQVIDVYNQYAKGANLTNREIAFCLGWDACQVTPRVGELRRKGQLVYAGTRKCGVTGFTAMTWRLWTWEKDQ